MPVKKKPSPIDTTLLRALCEVHAPSGEEFRMKEFLLSYIRKEKKNWKYPVEVIHGEELQDCLILRFGKPRTAVFAHMDTIGFTVRYFNQLVAIGSPDADDGARLTGHDSKGPIDCTLEYDKDSHAFFKFGRPIDRGTSLVYKPDFRETADSIRSPYLDNRLGILNALNLCRTLKDGLIVFSCWEEHVGGSVPYLADLIYRKWRVRQALISDITWISDGVVPGKGVVISLRDRNVPRRLFIDKIISLTEESNIPYQLEVEGSGSSDGGELQRSHLPFDWCFIGAGEHGPHTPHETVHKQDILAMFRVYEHLMKKL
ncbi:MAG: aminopeptidase [Bacteroidota bacterium]